MGHFYDADKNYPTMGPSRYTSGYETISEVENKSNILDHEVIFVFSTQRRYSLDTHTNTKSTDPEFTSMALRIPSLSLTKALMPWDETKKLYTVHADPKYTDENILIDVLRSIGIPEDIHPWGHSIFTFNADNEYIQF